MTETDGIYPHGYPVWSWEPWSRPSIVHLSLGQDQRSSDPLTEVPRVMSDVPVATGTTRSRRARR